MQNKRKIVGHWNHNKIITSNQHLTRKFELNIRNKVKQ